MYDVLSLEGAHPRSRGEHKVRSEIDPTGTGSSPLARGTQKHNTVGFSTKGLIPARAGNTRRAFHRWRGCRAHPRSRGEHTGLPWPTLHEQGSSPLARGTHLVLNLLSNFRGLIPARAGNTHR